MRLCTLGTLELRPARFTRPKPLLLAAYLALEGPQARRVLAERFWPGAADPMKSLGVALARLRAGAPGLVDADRERARCLASSDAGAFLAGLEEGELAEALDLYRGPFLDGCRPLGCSPELEEWVVETRELLAGRARWALLARAERQAAAGASREAARSAARAHAVRGATPPDPRDLARIHALLEAGGHPAEPQVRAEATRFGVAPLATRPASPARAGPGPAHAGAPDLPAAATTLVGRRREVGALTAWLARPGCRLATVTGPAGVGKSRVVLEVARRRRGEGRPVRIASLATPIEPGRPPGWGAAACAAGTARGEDLLAWAADGIGDRSLLLVLDDAPPHTGRTASLARLLEDRPALRLLIAARRRTGLRHEQVFPLTGLPCPPADAVGAGEAIAYDGVRLFVQCARRVRPSFVLDEETLPGVIRICRLTEGLPLGLTLAAAWVRVLPPAEIAREIERDLDVLATDAPDATERHRSMRAAFDESWRHLPRRERDALLRLAAFRGGFTREAAHEVAGAGLPVLAALVDASLLRVDRRGRYHPAPLLFRYLRAKLDEDPALDAAVRASHVAFYARRLRAWRDELRGGARGRVLADLAVELENVRAACAGADVAPGEAHARRSPVAATTTG